MQRMFQKPSKNKGNFVCHAETCEIKLNFVNGQHECPLCGNKFCHFHWPTTASTPLYVLSDASRTLKENFSDLFIATESGSYHSKKAQALPSYPTVPTSDLNYQVKVSVDHLYDPVYGTFKTVCPDCFFHRPL